MHSFAAGAYINTVPRFNRTILPGTELFCWTFEDSTLDEAAFYPGVHLLPALNTNP